MADTTLSLARLSETDAIATLDRVGLKPSDIAGYCERWQIVELALFGSILRDDFRPDSDLDCLVVFAPEAQIGLLDLLGMQQDLGDRIGRAVDVVMRSNIEHSDNYIRRANIFGTARTIYPAAIATTPTALLPTPPTAMTIPNDRDRATLLDILKAAKQARNYGRGMTAADLEADELRHSAILYQLTLLGEATKRLSPEFPDRYDRIQWKQIAGTRNFLIHEYDNVNLAVVSDIINRDISALLPEIEALVREFC